MSHICQIPALLMAAFCTCAGAEAQVRKTKPPVDTSVLDLLPVPLEPRRPKVELSGMGFYHPMELPPEFPGGTRAMYQFIQANLRMPQEATKAGVSGRVFASFTVEVTGEIKDVTVLRGLGFGCDEEAVRLIKLMPRWKPAQQDYKIVKVKYNLPISFAAKQ